MRKQCSECRREKPVTLLQGMAVCTLLVVWGAVMMGAVVAASSYVSWWWFR